MQELVVASVSGDPVALETSTWCSADIDRVWSRWRDRIMSVMPSDPDLVVLPELFDRPVERWSPFTPLPVDSRREFALHKCDELRNRLAQLATETSTTITYPSYRVEAGQVYNSVELIGPDGASLGFGDKLVPTPGEVTALDISAGTDIGTFDLEFGRTSSIICFDLNFPEVHARLRAARSRLILFPSAYHGGLMQNYVAYQSRAYLISSVYPPNPSSVVNPLGSTVAESSTYNFSLVATVNLDYEVVHLDGNADKLADARRRYGRDISITEPGRLGAAMVTSCTEDVTAAQVVDELQMERLDDYFNRSTTHLQ